MGAAIFALTFSASATSFAFECSDAAKAKARDFIDNEKQFHLGFLPTEQSNPITATLEEDFKRSTLAGVQCLQRGDRQIPITMRHVFASQEFARLVDSMVATLTTPSLPHSLTPPLPHFIFPASSFRDAAPPDGFRFFSNRCGATSSTAAPPSLRLKSSSSPTAPHPS